MLVVFCWYVFEATTEAVARINPFNAVVVEVGRLLHVHQALGDLLGNAQEILIQLKQQLKETYWRTGHHTGSSGSITTSQALELLERNK